MLSILSHLIKKLTNPVGFIIFLIIYSVSFYLYFFSGYPFSIKNVIAVRPYDETNERTIAYSPETFYESYYKSGIPDLQIFNSAKDTYKTFTDFGYYGRRAYEHVLLADILYPTIYGFFYSILLSIALKKAFPGRPELMILNVLPFGATLMDYVENAAVIQMIIAFPNKLRNIGSIPGYFTLGKHLFMFVSEAAIAACFAVALYYLVRGREPEEETGL